MHRISYSALLLTTLLVLFACLPSSPTSGAPPVVKLTVQTRNGGTIFSQAGEVITYEYTAINAGTKLLAGPVTIRDGSKQVNCPAVTTVGNFDDYLDPNETIRCEASYTVTQADVTAASITNIATATISGLTSNQGGITLTLGTQTPGNLRLAKTASPQAYSQAGQFITYTYVITNSGINPLGPAQFTISDNRLGAPFPCGPGGTTLASNQSVACAETYTVTQADLNQLTLTNSATASGAGQTSAPASVTIFNLNAPATQGFWTQTPAASVTLVPGSTVQHQVMEGEWLIQITRCYGANLSAVQAANPEITDPGSTLPPPLTVIIPGIGSDGLVHGPPCIAFYTVEAGDTWESIASRFVVDVVFLQDANRDVTLASGVRLRIPLYSETPDAYPPGYTPATSQRFELTAGGNPETVSGIVSPSDPVWYVVTLPETHILSLKLSGAAEALVLTVYDTNGNPYNPSGGSLTWTGFIPATGDYYIEVSARRGAATVSFTLEASLSIWVPSPTPPPSGMLRDQP